MLNGVDNSVKEVLRGELFLEWGGKVFRGVLKDTFRIEYGFRGVIL